MYYFPPIDLTLPNAHCDLDTAHLVFVLVSRVKDNTDGIAIDAKTGGPQGIEVNALDPDIRTLVSEATCSNVIRRSISLSRLYLLSPPMLRWRNATMLPSASVCESATTAGKLPRLVECAQRGIDAVSNSTCQHYMGALSFGDTYPSARNVVSVHLDFCWLVVGCIVFCAFTPEPPSCN